MLRIALVGYGKMGRKVEEIAAHSGDKIVARIGREDLDWAEAMRADVVVDFATPSDPKAHVDRLLSLKRPLVLGATGWEGLFSHVQECVALRSIGVVISPNFSLGVGLFRRVLCAAGKLFGQVSGYEAGLIEMHHREKRDQPSGTAKAMQADLEKTTPFRKVPVSSLRIGKIEGVHELVLDSQEDVLTFCHRAKSRAPFARGAHFCAKWVVNRCGLFRFEDVLEEVIEEEALCT